MRHTDLTSKQCRKTAGSLQMIAIQMLSAIRAHQAIVLAGQEPQDETHVYAFRTYCPNCHDQPASEPANEPPIDEMPRPDPAHKQEIEYLVKYASLTEKCIWARCQSRDVPARGLFAGIKSLVTSLLRQQQYFRAIAPQPRIDYVFVDEPEDCQVCLTCGKPFENYSDGEWNQ